MAIAGEPTFPMSVWGLPPRPTRLLVLDLDGTVWAAEWRATA